MDIPYEDRKLHDDGLFDGLMGNKEWFHYVGTYDVNKAPLTFMLGFPRSFTGMGAFGWISFKGHQYALAGNRDTDYNGFHELQRIPVQVTPSKTGYTLQYKNEIQPDQVYAGEIVGQFPKYKFHLQTPDLDITIEMAIAHPDTSVFQKEVFEWMPGKKRIASWFHSGDVTTSLTGSLEGTSITAGTKSRGWYERMWSKVPVLWPSEWFWFMAHMDNGAVFDLYAADSAGRRVHPLDECWIYNQGIFHEFSDYKAELSKEMEKSIEKKDYSKIMGTCIECEGKNGGNSFKATATVNDFRQYEFKDYSANIKYTNFMFDIEGEAVIDGETLDMKGRGAAERAPILYWWV